ncbi:hypothetical protein TNCV_977731 [Trichonephila clavipes]|nr:hypothetical protein TNCV_977731 [Trichonephila clavipes]
MSMFKPPPAGVVWKLVEWLLSRARGWSAVVLLPLKTRRVDEAIPPANVVVRKEECQLRCPPRHSTEAQNYQLDTLRENCGIIRKQASTDGGVLWKVVRVNVVQVRRKDRSLRDPREARSRVRVRIVYTNSKSSIV